MVDNVKKAVMVTSYKSSVLAMISKSVESSTKNVAYWPYPDSPYAYEKLLNVPVIGSEEGVKSCASTYPKEYEQYGKLLMVK